MAIAFARMEFVKRSDGKVACAKSAYNSRGKIEFQGNEFNPQKTYDWSHKEPVSYHNILLPDHVDPSYKNPEKLWNLVESTERRKNSVVAFDMVLALPDDEAITLEDKIILAESFAKLHFSDKGYGVQIDIHPPDKDGKNNNCHVHFLITTRRFNILGTEFEIHKPRDMMTVIRNGKVISGPQWGKLWALFQNQFFEEKGLDLRVDIEGIVPQIHLGPVRMRGRAYDILEDHDQRLDQNKILSNDPTKILKKITETQSVFSKQDVDRFILKHVDIENQNKLMDEILINSDLIQLYDKDKLIPLEKFTTKEVVEEEKKILRLADCLNVRKQRDIDLKGVEKYSEKLNREQETAFKNILKGGGIACIEGHAGTGKSYLLKALCEAYESNGFLVRSFGPDNATASVLKEKGLSQSDNVYHFLFSVKYGVQSINKENEIWLIDESGKLGNRALLELLKVAEQNKVKVIFSGNTAQISSVERGGMFKIFSERYECQFLQDIQRQKCESDRIIARKLACGKISEAFDGIHNTGGFHWTDTKFQALEKAAYMWAKDEVSFPNSNKIIIAHANSEVKVLNELVRGYRKQLGEVGQQDYECMTKGGKIFVSVGDKIEFRKNDSVLKVTNGLIGKIVKANVDEFVVSIQEKEKVRELAFNPNSYNAFQLAYATTYYRSQGMTVDRAYVIASSQMNKELFYVGLTRHVENVACIVSKDQASCLMDLKRKAMKSGHKLTTLDFTTAAEMEKIAMAEKRAFEIDQLKQSYSIIDRIKGYGSSAFEVVYNTVAKKFEKSADLLPNSTFYTPKSDEVADNERKVYLAKEETLEVKPKLIDFPKNNQPPTSSVEKNYDKPFNKLQENQKLTLKNYFSLSDQASDLYSIVQSESESKETDIKGASHFSEWQSACKDRNKQAYDVLKSVPSSELKKIMSEKALDILHDRSSKYEVTLTPKIDLQDQLLKNIEPLLFRLFPEGQFRGNFKERRFGQKGSLSVTVSGEKAGHFYDFEEGKGGKLLKLIEKTQGIDSQGSKDWALKFLDESSSIDLPKNILTNKLVQKQDKDWISLKPPKNCEVPDLNRISSSLDKSYNLVAKHRYTDLNGETLFYNLRLVDKDDPFKKIILPLGYGYYKGADSKPKWGLKRYTEEQGTPLYNLHLLQKYQDRPVLIVEGEKAADAGNKLFGDKMICISWMGGTGGVNKANWSPLFYREVTIWPDNDEAGYKAAKDIETQLKKIGVKELRTVDIEFIKKELPQKWDIADAVPEGKSQSFIKDTILRANSKAVGIHRLINWCNHDLSHEQTKGQLIKLNEVLFSVDDRIRSKNESLSENEIQNKILQEFSSVMKDKKLQRSVYENSKEIQLTSSFNFEKQEENIDRSNEISL